MTRDFLRLSIVALLLALMTASATMAAPVSNETGLLLPDLSSDWWKDN